MVMLLVPHESNSLCQSSLFLYRHPGINQISRGRETNFLVDCILEGLPMQLHKTDQTADAFYC